MNAIISQGSNDLTAPDSMRLDQNPAAVFLANLKSANSRRNMARYLNEIARMLGTPKAESSAVVKNAKGRPPKPAEFTYLYCNWAALRFSYTMAIVTQLTERYAPATVNVMLSALRQVLYYAWKLELMNAEDYRRAVDIENVTSTTLPAGRDISTGEMMALANACTADVDKDGKPTIAGIRDAAIIGILYTCGLRRSEVVNLELKNYEADSGKLSIIAGKGRKDRTVYVSNGASQALADWLAIRGEEPGALFLRVNKADKIEWGKEPDDKNKEKRGHITDQAIYNILLKRGKEANVKDFAAHDFRRTFAGDMLDRGVDIVTVQKIMGHADPKTTSRYDRRPEKVKQDAASKLHFPYSPKQSRMV
jgi:site-specific recombinase XerD